MRRIVPLASSFLGIGLSLLLALSACSTDDVDASPARGPRDLIISKVESLGYAATDPGVEAIPEVKEAPGVTPTPAVPAIPGGVTLNIDCTGTLLVWLEPYDAAEGKLGDFKLAPPGDDCGQQANCGWIVVAYDNPVKPDPPENVAGAGTAGAGTAGAGTAGAGTAGAGTAGTGGTGNAGTVSAAGAASAPPKKLRDPTEAIRSPIQLYLPPELRSGVLTLQVRLKDWQGQWVQNDDGTMLTKTFVVNIVSAPGCP